MVVVHVTRFADNLNGNFADTCAYIAQSCRTRRVDDDDIAVTVFAWVVH